MPLATFELLCLLAAAALATQDAPRSEPASPTPQVLIEDLAGGRRRVPLEGFELRELEGFDGMLLSFENLAQVESAPNPERAVARLVGGGRALGLVRGGEGEFLWLELVGGARLRLPISALESLTFPGRVPADWTGALVGSPEGDRLFRYRAGGLDRIDGGVEGFETEGVRFDSPLGSKVFPWAEVSALFVEVLEEEEPEADEQGPGALVVDLFDGSRLRGSLVLLDAEGLSLETEHGGEVHLPLGTIAEIALEDPRLSFLSDLAPSGVEARSPFGDELGMVWPHQVDASVGGGPLRVAGSIYTRGIGVHAPSRLAWSLGGEWRSLRGSVAVDDEVLRLAARGSVRFQVLCDGELRWESPVVAGGEGALALPEIALEGVDELSLVVDMGDDWVADRADWLRMILVR